MLSGLITAILQLLAAKFGAPFALKATAAVAAAVKIKEYGPVAEPLLNAGGIGMMIFLVGLIVSLIMGGRVPLIGALLLTIIFALIPTALEIYVRGMHMQLMDLLRQCETYINMPLNEFVLIGLFAFVGYWLSVAMRGPAREY